MQEQARTQALHEHALPFSILLHIQSLRVELRHAFQSWRLERPATHTPMLSSTTAQDHVLHRTTPVDMTAWPWGKEDTDGEIDYREEERQDQEALKAELQRRHDQQSRAAAKNNPKPEGQNHARNRAETLLETRVARFEANMEVMKEKIKKMEKLTRFLKTTYTEDRLPGVYSKNFHGYRGSRNDYGTNAGVVHGKNRVMQWEFENFRAGSIESARYGFRVHLSSTTARDLTKRLTADTLRRDLRENHDAVRYSEDMHCKYVWVWNKQDARFVILG